MEGKPRPSQGKRCTELLGRWGGTLSCGTIRLVSSTTAEIVEEQVRTMQGGPAAAPDSAQRTRNDGEDKHEEEQFGEVDDIDQAVTFQLSGPARAWHCSDGVSGDRQLVCKSGTTTVFGYLQLILPLSLPVPPPHRAMGVSFGSDRFDLVPERSERRPMAHLRAPADPRAEPYRTTYGEPFVSFDFIGESLALHSEADLSDEQVEAIAILLAMDAELRFSKDLLTGR